MTAEFGTPLYTRIDAAATPEEKAKLLNLSPEAVQGCDASRRANHGEADARSGEQCSHRRAKGHGNEWLVRGAPLGDGKHL